MRWFWKLFQKKDQKPILLVDFDGVLHGFDNGWQGRNNFPNSAVTGSMFFLWQAVIYFNVCIFSARSRRWGGRKAMKKWLRRELVKWFAGPAEMKKSRPMFFHERETLVEALMSKIRFPLFKLPGHLIIDDRCWCFTGKFPTMQEISDFTPWHGHGVYGQEVKHGRTDN